MLSPYVKLPCHKVAPGFYFLSQFSHACLSLFPLREVAKPGLSLVSISLCKRGLCRGLLVPLWLRGLTWRVGLRVMQVARSLQVTVLSLLIIFIGDGEWRSITPNRFVLNMVQGHHLQLRSCPPMFCYFQQFNVKVAATHHPIIQREVDELLSKGGIEPSSGGAGFYSSVFVVPRQTGGLWPTLNGKWFNHYLHIPYFKMPTFKHLQQLIQWGDYAFSIYLRMLIYIFLWLSIIIIFYALFGTICHISGRFYLLGWPQSLEFSQPSLKLSCSFAIARVSILLSIWMTSWSWFTLSRQVRGLTHFCVPYWFTLDYVLIFLSLTFAYLSLFVSLGYVGILSICQYLYRLIN